MSAPVDEPPDRNAPPTPAPPTPAPTSPAPKAQDTSTQDTSTQDTSTQDTSTQDTSTQDTITQDTSTQDTSTQDTITQDRTTERATSKGAVSGSAGRQPAGFLPVSADHPAHQFASHSTYDPVDTAAEDSDEGDFDDEEDEPWTDEVQIEELPGGNRRRASPQGPFPASTRYPESSLEIAAMQPAGKPSPLLPVMLGAVGVGVFIAVVGAVAIATRHRPGLEQRVNSEGYVGARAVAMAQRDYHAIHGSYLSTPVCPSAAPGESRPFEGPCAEAWSELGWTPDGPVQCRYQTISVEADRFDVTVICDSDQDGEIAIYTAGRSRRVLVASPPDVW